MSQLKEQVIKAEQEPLVSVVTPVYNGEQYIRECINSVLEQTYSNWEYIVLDNCSTDNTLSIVNEYCQKDARIKVISNDSTLPVIENWNAAMRLIDQKSKYCKVVHADDWLFPECVRHMVVIAEKEASIGIVGSYRLDEDKVNLYGLHFDEKIISGCEIVKRRLSGMQDLFGSPTSILIRSEIIRNRQQVYNEKFIHADTEFCFDVLRDFDFGFVHQVLSYTRRHNDSETSYLRTVNTHAYSHIYLAEKYGLDYLGEKELKNLLKCKWRTYYQSIGLTVLKLIYRKRWDQLPVFWEYHKSAIKELGYSISMVRLLLGSLSVLVNKSLQKLMFS
jgi:glycosyltransferase involved in cell wall biosynthesis